MTNDQAFLDAYIEAVYFTETGDNGQPSHEAELTPYFKAASWSECRNFCWAYGGLIEASGADFAQAGHDLWLTRNGHGVGFWDRPEIYGRELADELTRAAKAVGCRDADFNGLVFSKDELETAHHDTLIRYLESWGYEFSRYAEDTTDELRAAAIKTFNENA